MDRCYDNIWLSNIAHNLDNQEIENMIQASMKVLKEEGKLLLCYFWNTTMTVKGFSIEPFSSIEAEKIKVPGVSKNAGKNSILVYTKKK